jgi:3-oxoacyl-(acyl-carrier-protein) synthase
MRRVVVTGMGVVSSLGHCLNSSWKALLDHSSGIKSIADDKILKNDKPFNLALVRDFEYAKWKVPVVI